MRTGPERIVVLAVLLALFGALPLALSSPALTWLLLLPLAAGTWVLRARVVAGPDGLEICNGLRVHRATWDEVEGVDVPARGPLRLRLTGGRRRLLTALPRRDLRRVLAAGERAAGLSPGTPGTGTGPGT